MRGPGPRSAARSSSRTVANFASCPWQSRRWFEAMCGTCRRRRARARAPFCWTQPAIRRATFPPCAWEVVSKLTARGNLGPPRARCSPGWRTSRSRHALTRLFLPLQRRRRGIGPSCSAASVSGLLRATSPPPRWKSGRELRSRQPRGRPSRRVRVLRSPRGAHRRGSGCRADRASAGRRTCERARQAPTTAPGGCSHRRPPARRYPLIRSHHRPAGRAGSGTLRLPS